jgi:hypothetical protein
VSPEASQLLSKLELQQKNITAVSMRVEEAMLSKSPEKSLQPTRKTVTEFCRDGDKIDVSSSTYKITSPKDSLLDTTRSIWDGQRWLEYSQRPQTKIELAGISRKQNKAMIFSTAGPLGAALDGYFCQDILPFYAILKKSNNLHMLENREEIGGSLCYVVEGKTEYGYYKVWLDTNNGGLARKAYVRKEGSDIYITKPLSLPLNNPPGINIKPAVSMEYELYDVNIAKIEGQFVVCSGTRKMTTHLIDGSNFVDVINTVRKEITFNPDLSKAFIMDMPIGMRVWDQDLDGAASYVWNGNNKPLTAWVDIDTIQAIDTAVTTIAEPNNRTTLDKGTAKNKEKTADVKHDNQIGTQMVTSLKTENHKSNKDTLWLASGILACVIVVGYLLRKRKRKR